MIRSLEEAGTVEDLSGVSERHEGNAGTARDAREKHPAALSSCLSVSCQHLPLDQATRTKPKWGPGKHSL